MLTKKRTLLSLLLVCSMASGISGCASSRTYNAQGMEVNDPLEPVNRATLAFNEFLDTVFFNPITLAYRAVVPAAGRQMVTNVLANVRSPVFLANELLQGDLDGAATVLKRFAINTFTGFGGLLDTASWGGINYEPADFGQTLAVWGVDSGPYIVWPILGPSTLRDSVGLVADIALDPLYWYAHNTDRKAINYTRAGLTVLSAKDGTYNTLTDLRRHSGDYYTSLQSVYLQRREAQIRNANTGSTLPSILPQMD